MAESEDYIGRLEELVRRAAQRATAEERHAILELLPFVTRLPEQSTRLKELQKEIAELQKKASDKEKPLRYGVFLGWSKPKSRTDGNDGDEDIASEKGELLEAIAEVIDQALTRASSDKAARLAEVREVLQRALDWRSPDRDLIVGVGGQRYELNLADPELSAGQFLEGQEVVLDSETKVVGVRSIYLRGETAEVVNVLHPPGTAKVVGLREEEGKLMVQWPDASERFEVKYEPAVAPVNLGHVVRLDSTNQMAVEKVRPRLHVRAGGSEGIIVEISDSLFKQGVEIGDIVRLDSRLHFAFERLPSYEVGGLSLEEVPDVSYEDIGGLGEQISEIQDAIELPYVYRRLFEEFHLHRPKGILLHGPPGCGKTMIAKAVANNLTRTIRVHLRWLEWRLQAYLDLKAGRRTPRDVRASGPPTANPDEAAMPSWLSPENAQAGWLPEDVADDQVLPRLAEDLRLNDIDVQDAAGALERVRSAMRDKDGVRSFFLNVKGPELLNKFVGETEHRIRKVFEAAKRRAGRYTPVVIFFDEMEAMFRTRGSGRSSDVETTIVPQFLAEMDGVESSENVVIIGATNRPDLIDPAILRPGRLDVKIKIGSPGREEAVQVLMLYLTPDLPLSPDGLRPHAPTPGRKGKPFQAHVVNRTLEVIGRSLNGEGTNGHLAARPTQGLLAAARELLRVSEKDGAQVQGQALPPATEEAQRVAQEFARREALARAMIEETVAILFSSTSRIEAVTSAGNRNVYPLREFVSGAVLANVMARAKKTAAKRKVTATVGPSGITVADLRSAALAEFKENAEQLAAGRLAAEFGHHSQETVQVVEVHLGGDVENPWSLEKVRIPRHKAS